MVSVLFEFVGRQAHKSLLDFERCFAFGDAGAIRDAEYVRVDGNSRFAKSGVENDVGRFATYARQTLECFTCCRYLAVVFDNQKFAGLDDVLGLVVIKAYRFDIRLQPFYAERQY